jgi:hypothetical protein
MQLCVERDQRRHRSAPGTPLAVPVAAAAMPPPAIITRKDSSKPLAAAATAGKKEVRRPSSPRTRPDDLKLVTTRVDVEPHYLQLQRGD